MAAYLPRRRTPAGSALLLFACGWLAGHQPAGVVAASAAEWRSRTIYQLLTDRFAVTSGDPPCPNLGDYCGGSFTGITQQLDYIQSMGFDAIWISPIPANTPGGYHGYWQAQMYTVNPYFGSAGDLTTLVRELHARGMWLMLDVVGNHMGIPPNYDPSSFYPFNTTAYYHDCAPCPAGCNIDDYTDLTQMEHCRLDGLYDLNQSDPWVASQLLTWITNITSTYAVDGLRLDTVPYVWSSFWTQFQQAAGMYIVGEVDTSNVTFVAQYQGALDATLSYPMFYTLRDVFAYQNSMYGLQSTWQAYGSSFSDLTVLGNFVDNHDNPRFLNERDDAVAYRNALAWVLLSEGIPIVYYGTEAGFSGGNDPACREILWPTVYAGNASALGTFITTLVAYRKSAAVWDYAQVQRYADDTFYAFTRGTTFVALTNVGTGGATQSRTITYQPYANGQVLCNLFQCSDCVTVGNASFDVTLTAGEPKVYAPSIHC